MDDRICATTCTADSQCAAGFECESTKCLPSAKPTKCTDDLTAAINTADGKSTLCAPFICDSVTSTCKAFCNTGADCQTAFECSSSNVCARPSAPTADEGGCGCETAPRPGTWSLLSALPFVMLLGLRRRRAR